MTHVYVLTEEGRKYSDAGIQYVLNETKQITQNENGIDISFGKRYNKPDFLIRQLTQHKNAIIFVSMSDKIVSFYNENIDDFIAGMKENPNLTSWETAVNMIHATLNPTE